MNDILEKNFNFWMPIDISKAKESDDGKVRVIEGIASTPDVDLQNEKVVVKGIDYSYFLKHGYFNWDHQKGPDNKVGEPWICKAVPEGLYVKGFLYKGKKVADALWEHIQSLKSNPQSNRKVGFSLEGKTLLKKGQNILKCWIKDIAITTAPINYNTYLDVVKSLSSYNFSKALSAGHASANQSGGSALIPEDLSGRGKSDDEDKLTDVNYGREGVYTKKSLETLISRHLGYSRKSARDLTNILFQLSEN